MNKFKKIFLVTLSVISGTVYAAEETKEVDEIKNVPFVFSVASNEFWFASKKDISANYAFGLLGSTLYQVNGIQGSSLYNITHEVNGVQLAGVSNINTDNFSGFQGSGVFNINGAEFSGAQLSGVFNINGAGFNGLQSSGFMNIAGGGDSRGAQIAGVLNICKENLRGAQIGLINICSGDCGFQLGLINIAENGILELGASYTSNNDIRLAFNSGNQYCYTVLGVKCRDRIFKKNDGKIVLDNFVSFAGLGTRQQFSIFNFDLEAYYNSVYFRDNENKFRTAGYLSGRAVVGVTPVKHFNLFAGYTMSFEHADFCDSDIAFKCLKSNFRTHLDNGLTLHHEIDAGIKIQFR